MGNDSNIIKNASNRNSIILQSKKDFTQFLFALCHKKEPSFAVHSDIYNGKYDKRLYPFVHAHISFLLMKLLNNLSLKCPFYKNKIKLIKSVYDYKSGYKNLSGLYTIKGDHIPDRMDIACIVSTVPNKSNGKNKYTLQPYTLIKKVTAHINVIIMKTQTPNLCFSFHSVVCPSGLKMKLSHIENKRLSGQMLQWKHLVKKRTLTNSLCYTITEVPTLTLHKYMQKNTFENDEWKSILFQTLFTLHILQKEIPGFVHHNLTPKYIHLKKVPVGGQFVYKIGNKTFYVPNHGYVVKILPSSYSYASKMYENVIVHDEEFQSMLGLHPDNTQFYDLHLFCNTLYHTKNVPMYVKKLIKQWVPVRLLGDKNNTLLINHRLRIQTEKPTKQKTFYSILTGKTFTSFTKLNKNKIVFYPKIKV